MPAFDRLLPQEYLDAGRDGLSGELSVGQTPMNWRSMLAQFRTWFPRARDVDGIEVRHRRLGKLTIVNVSVELPHHMGRGRPRYRATTAIQVLDPQGFPDPNLRKQISADAQKSRHRALFLWDEHRGLTLAAISFHIDERTTAPYLLTDIAVRQDDPAATSRLALHVLLDVLRQAAEKDQFQLPWAEKPRTRNTELGALATDAHHRAVLSDYGFRPRTKPRAIRKAGDWYAHR